jgi:peptidyl-prolyl cis-trans isomerase B (cyclophilin B)
MKKTLLIKLILVTLTLTMMLSCFIACDKTEEPAGDGKETSQNAGNNGDKTPPAAPTDSKDMNDMLAEINAWKAEDFEETSEKTEYLKITVKGYGDIVIRLRRNIAPSNVGGIQMLVPYGWYNGLTFHRVADGYIQGGCPNGDGTGVSGNSMRGEFADNNWENPLKHVRGVVSAFRFDDDPNSASCQFLILNKDCPAFDGNRSAMGYVVAGMDVVDAIAAVKTTDGKPAERIVMEKVVFAKMK